MKPWMSPIEIDFIKEYLSEDKVMLEYGSGGSTGFFPQFVKEYYSIEHVEDWYEEVGEHLLTLPYKDKVHNYLIKPDYPRTIPTKYREFKSYIEYVDTINKKYDIVLIDGRARAQCAEYVIPYLNDDAVVFIHDYYMRHSYRIVEKDYNILGGVSHGQSIVALTLKK